MRSFKVIQILNEKEILIDYGIRHGAYEGQKVRIYEPGKEVVDPETNRSLGNLDFIKETLQIFVAYDAFSICRKVVVETVPIIPPLPKRTTSKTTFSILNVDPNHFTDPERFKKNSLLKVGDSVMILK